MTDDVAAHVLRDNYEQNVLLGNARVQSPPMLPVHQRFIRDLERRGELDRDAGVPAADTRSTAAAGRARAHVAEFAVLVAYSKITLTHELLATRLPDEPWFACRAAAVLPAAARRAVRRPASTGHPLRREIVITGVVNELVNRAGITFVFRAQEETGAHARRGRPRLRGRPRGVRAADFWATSRRWTTRCRRPRRRRSTWSAGG